MAKTVTVTELAAFSICQQKAAFIRKKQKLGTKPSGLKDVRLKGSFVHAILERQTRGKQA